VRRAADGRAARDHVDRIADGKLTALDHPHLRRLGAMLRLRPEIVHPGRRSRDSIEGVAPNVIDVIRNCVVPPGVAEPLDDQCGLSALPGLPTASTVLSYSGPNRARRRPRLPSISDDRVATTVPIWHTC